MRREDHDEVRGEALERQLLGAARSDEGAPDVQRAWQRFAGRVGALSAAIEPTSGVHLLPRESASADVTSLVRPDPAPQPQSVAARARWLAIGAIGGSVLTASVFAFRPQPSDEPAIAVTTQEAAAVIVPNPTRSSAAAGDVEPRAPSPSRPRSLDVVPEVSAKPASELPTPRPKTTPARRPQATRYSIADEVRALDAARAACKHREYERCFLVSERFGDDYPKSALRPDAEVLALQALEALGRSETANRRAAEFLERYPTDPHAERVRAVQRRTGPE